MTHVRHSDNAYKVLLETDGKKCKKLLGFCKRLAGDIRRQVSKTLLDEAEHWTLLEGYLPAKDLPSDTLAGYSSKKWHSYLTSLGDAT